MKKPRSSPKTWGSMIRTSGIDVGVKSIVGRLAVSAAAAEDAGEDEHHDEGGQAAAQDQGRERLFGWRGRQVPERRAGWAQQSAQGWGWGQGWRQQQGVGWV